MSWMRTGYLVVGSGSVVGALLWFSACSTENPTNPGVTPNPNKDASTSTDGSSQGDGTVPIPDGATGDGGVECGTLPKLRDSDGSTGPFCTFMPKDAATPYCAAGQACCNTGSAAAGPSFCGDNLNCGFSPDPLDEPDASTLKKEFQCTDPDHCSNGDVCCLVGKVVEDFKCPGSFFAPSASVRGSRCTAASACNVGESQLCNNASECPAGYECKAMETAFIEFGFCRQTDGGTVADAAGE